MASGEPSERTAPSSPDGPAAQLRDLRQQLRAGNADLYRHLALYLQVLREVLPTRVERCCFHLATQQHPLRYVSLPGADRRQLHRRLNALVRGCSSLLTVEQLGSLAGQMAQERRRQDRQRRGRLLQRFSASEEPQDMDNASGLDASVRAMDGGAPPLPEGSIDLDGSLPLSAGLLRELREGRNSAAMDTALFDSEVADFRDGSPDESSRPEAFAAAPAQNRMAAQDENEFPPLLRQLLAEMAPGGSSPAAIATDLPAAGSLGNPWSSGQLPDDPPTLLRWLDGIEQALTRRLRNLSHAINVELLRVGLSGGLLPVPLLDAALAGQIESQPAPPNQLRLPLPFPADDASPLVMSAVLLRSVDLELEEPRLRTCRRRLQQHRQEVRRMAQQFRRLQRRREAHEAEQLWFQDSRSPSG